MVVVEIFGQEASDAGVVAGEVGLRGRADALTVGAVVDHVAGAVDAG